MRIFLLFSDKGDFRISEEKELSVSRTDQMWPLGGTVYFYKNIRELQRCNTWCIMLFRICSFKLSKIKHFQYFAVSIERLPSCHSSRLDSGIPTIGWRSGWPSNMACRLVAGCNYQTKRHRYSMSSLLMTTTFSCLVICSEKPHKRSGCI